MTGRVEKLKDRLRFSDVLLLILLSAAAMAVEGYHPYVEDAEIYLPGIKKLLHPSLYPRNDAFFASHAGMTMFPNLIAASVRLTHLPFDWALLLWQFLCTFVILLACWKIGRLVFRDRLARWGGVALVASLFSLPVAGTTLYIVDQYLNTRSLSTAAVLMMVACAAERRYVRASGWAVFTAAIHPLMFVFGFSYTAILVFLREQARQPEDVQPERLAARSAAAGAALLLPLVIVSPKAFLERLFPPVTPVYRQVLQTRPGFFLSQWHWYEILGLLAPFAVIGLFEWLARRRDQRELAWMCRALNCFGALFALASLLTIPAFFERFTLLQPMRYLHLTYILMFLFAGGLLAEHLLRRRLWLWLLLFVPLCGGMCYAGRQTFPDSPQLELPGVASPNPWVQAFLWIRKNTPVDAYFALNPRHMALAGEDEQGFRALAERSMMADAVKDSGVVTLFPGLAKPWKQQTDAEAGWNNFRAQDFERLKQQYGVSWVVLKRNPYSEVTGLNCLYHNAVVEVCKTD